MHILNYKYHYLIDYILLIIMLYVTLHFNKINCFVLQNKIILKIEKTFKYSSNNNNNKKLINDNDLIKFCTVVNSNSDNGLGNSVTISASRNSSNNDILTKKE